MGAPPARPSAKGYTPVPIEELIDDDVQSPQTEAEVEEDDDDSFYTTSAPLLSNRSRGNEPPKTPTKSRWSWKLGSSKLFRRRDPTNRSWDPPSKGRNWRLIILSTLFGFLLLAVIALATATGVLAGNFDQYKKSNGGCVHWKHTQNTHIPFNYPQRSSNNRLDFERVYPPLEASSSSACKATWSSLWGTPCHEKIWNRSWDNGKHSLFDPEPGMYAEAICTSQCKNAIERALYRVSYECTEDDKFNMTDYAGPFMADAGLEDGPLSVITTIAKRLTHACRKEPTSNWRSDYCATIMWEDWVIVDGMNAGNLEGLDNFEAKTRTERSESETWSHRYTQLLDCDDIHWNVNRRLGARHYGPEVNATTCDWCTVNWFERKLLAWKKDEVRDPKTGHSVDLPEYLKRIQHAGQRCEAGAWNRVWAKALRNYKESGDLPKDWEDGEKKGDQLFHILPIVSGDAQ